MAENNVDVVVLNWTGELIYRLSPPELRNVEVRREQFLGYNDQRSGILSKEFIRAKFENQKSVLGSLAKNREHNNPDVYRELILYRESISRYVNKLKKVKNGPIEDIRGKIFGLEGKASIEYWNGVALILPPEFGFDGRTGRGATDAVNSMLNYGYGILKGYIWRATHLAGLDPYAGYLHADRWGRTSLVFDLIEEFRQQVVDRTVLRLVNRRVVKESEFTLDDSLCHMSDKVRILLVSSILEKMESKIKFNEKNISWARVINHQANLLAKYLIGKSDYKGFYRRW